MRNKVFVSFLLLILGMGLLTGCKIDKPINGNDKIYQDSEIKTPLTDKLKLTADYIGKDFLEDGIGEVELFQLVDGDTTLFQTKSGEVITVRYNGIDTPESTYKVEPWGFAASRFVKETLTNAKANNKPIVLQADELKTGRIDSTGKRYLAWVWVDGRLLNLELVEKCYTPTKAAGTMYAQEMINASIQAQNLNIRIWNNKVKDPEYDYSEVGISMSLEELNERYNNLDAITEELDKGLKVRVRGIVTKKASMGSAYIKEQVAGFWYIGSNNTEVNATDEGSELPYIGDNGNWFVDETDLGVKAGSGQVGQNAYEVYVDSIPAGETPKTQYAWAKEISVTEPDANNLIPYIVREDKWYGMYIYGGYNDITSFAVGREIYTSAKIGYYNDQVQLTDIDPFEVGIISFNVVQPMLVTAEDFIGGKRDLLGLFVALENVTVVDGYDTKTSDGFTLRVKTDQGAIITIRIHTNVYLYDDDGKRIDSWQHFKDVRFDQIAGIMSLYEGNLQILPYNQSDLTY